MPGGKARGHALLNFSIRASSFGEHGDGHVRFSLIENEERTRQVIRGIQRMIEHD